MIACNSGYFKCSWVPDPCPKKEEKPQCYPIVCEPPKPAPCVPICTPASCSPPPCPPVPCLPVACCPEKKEEKKCSCDEKKENKEKLDIDRYIKCACKDGYCVCYKQDKGTNKWERYKTSDPHQKKSGCACQMEKIEWPDEPWF